MKTLFLVTVWSDGSKEYVATKATSKTSAATKVRKRFERRGMSVEHVYARPVIEGAVSELQSRVAELKARLVALPAVDFADFGKFDVVGKLEDAEQRLAALSAVA